MISPDQLRADLSQYTGTDHYYYNQLNKNIKYTDGVSHFLIKAEAFWFLDIFLTEIVCATAKWTTDDFFIVTLTSKDSKGNIDVKAQDENGKDAPVFTKKIEFTDCPEGEWKFYFTNSVLYLPSEH